jgi:hypothetical protein
MVNFLSGAVTLGYLVVGLFFLRFWRRTADSLFAIFAIAFWLLAANQAIISLTGIDQEYYSWVYLLRAAAFGLIIVAILMKNLPARR